MIFRNFPERALGSRVKVKILLYMLSESTLTSERELSRIIRVSHMAVHKSMRELHDLNLVSPLRIGNAVSWRFNEDSYAYDAISSLKWMAAHTPMDDLKHVIREKFSRLRPKRVTIFGSVAEGKEEPGSDIDLLIIARNGKDKAGFDEAAQSLAGLCLRRYGNRLSPYIITEKQSREPAHSPVVKGSERGVMVI